jgi:hypothetical protein
VSDTTPDRALRAFRSHDSLDEPDTDGTVRVTSTPFDATVAATDDTDGRIEFTVTVRVPTLSTVTDGEVAEVVEDGWADTFRRRVENIGAVTAGDQDLTPQVDRDGEELVVTACLSDLDHDRGANDAVAVVDYAEGTYVQGVIPGYDYTAPVAGLIDAARAAGGG